MNQFKKENVKILVFTYNIPRDDQSSGERRLVGILELLACNHKVSLCLAEYKPWFLNKVSQDQVKKLESKNIHVVPVDKKMVKQALQAKDYDIGLFEFYWVARKRLGVFKRFHPNAVTIIDSVDVHFAREASQAEIGLLKKRKALKTRRRELDVYSKADITVAVSDQDKEILLQNGTGNVFVIPNVVATVPRNATVRKPVVVFIGGYLWPPNVDAVKWFSFEIWPHIRSLVPDARFLIIGSNPPDDVKALDNIPGIEVLGYIPDTAPYLSQAAVSVAPLRFGGGMKGKVNEAMAFGLPVVATTIGAQGFNAINGKHMLITDHPEKFAQYVAGLLLDNQKQREMGLTGQKLNERLCSPQAVKSNIELVIKKAGEILEVKKKK